MLSNGNPGAVEDAGDGRHRITWTDPHPKPCYLFALVAGDLVAVRTVSPPVPAATSSLASGCAAATRIDAPMRCAR